MKRRLKNAAGFTLVELIVVIAILGILAGVAVPTYSGYVKKANLAADQTLLDSINMAFASACIEEQVDIRTVSGAKLEIGEDGVLDVENSTLVNDDVAAAVGRYLGGEVKFKVLKTDGIEFDSEIHMFVIKDENLRMTAEQLQAAMEGSGFNDQGVISDMLGVLDMVDRMLAGGQTLDDLIGQAPQSIVDALGFTDMSAGFENMGVIHFANDAAGRTGQEVLDGAKSLITLLTPAYTGAAEAVTGDEIMDYYQQTLSGDALANFQAARTSNPDGALAQATDNLGLSFGDLNLNAKQVVAVTKYMGDTKNSADISGLGAMYALAAGFYHSDQGKALPQPDSFAEFDAVKSAMLNNNAAFMEYLNSDQAVKDMGAYVGVMTYLSTGEFGEDAKFGVEGFDYIKEALGWS